MVAVVALAVRCVYANVGGDPVSLAQLLSEALSQLAPLSGSQLVRERHNPLAGHTAILAVFCVVGGVPKLRAVNGNALSVQRFGKHYPALSGVVVSLAGALTRDLLTRPISRSSDGTAPAAPAHWFGSRVIDRHFF